MLADKLIDEKLEPISIKIDCDKNKYPDIILLSGDGNQWWSGSMNIGLKYVLDQKKYDYILLWNNDIKPAEDYFINLFQIFENSDSGIILCSKIFIINQNINNTIKHIVLM